MKVVQIVLLRSKSNYPKDGIIGKDKSIILNKLTINYLIHFNRFVPYKQQVPQVTNYSNIVNERCKDTFEKKILTSDLTLLTTNTIQDQNLKDKPPKLQLKVGPDSLNYLDFVAEGWRSEQGTSREVKETIEARQVQLLPLNSKDEKEKWFSIDNEEYEAKSVRITLLPKMIQMFCKKDNVHVIS